MVNVFVQGNMGIHSVKVRPPFLMEAVTLGSKAQHAGAQGLDTDRPGLEPSACC